MLLRLPNVPARLATVFFAAILGATLAYLSIRNARADYYANLATRAGYETAARLEPENAVNWYLLGRYWQYTLDEPDARRAILNYRHAISLNPHSAVTWLDLAAVYESEGDIQDGRAAYADPKRSAEAFSRCWGVAPDINFILSDVLPPDRDGYLAVIRELDIG